MFSIRTGSIIPTAKMVSGAALGSLLAILPFSSVALAIAPNISYTAPGGTTPFSILTLSGSGFAPGEPITISFGLSSANALADGSGSFSNASLFIPSLPSNLYYIVAVGQTSGSVAFTSIYVNSFYPTVSPSSWYLAPGSVLTWSGSGFAPNETITFMSATGTPLATFTADAFGAFAAAGSSTVPYSLRNSSMTGTIHSSVSGVTIPITLTIGDMYPYVTPSTWYAVPGTPVSFSGSQFGGSEGVSVYLGSGTSTIAHITTDPLGAFTTADIVTLPFGPGPAQFRFVGDESGATATAPITLAQFYPNVTPSAWFTYPGNALTFSAAGFAPNEVILMSGTATGTTTADGAGHASGLSARIPFSASGTASFTFTGEKSGASQTLNIALGVRTAAIWFDNYYAQAGTPLTVFGAGFGNDELVVLRANGTPFATTTANGSGDLNAHTFIPFAPAGSVSLTATGADTGVSASASLTVAPVYVDLQLASYAVAAGSPVTFIGHGYLPNDPIAVTTDRTGSSTVASFIADVSGSVNDASFIIPADWLGGNLTVTAHSNHSFNDTSVTLWVIGQ